MAPVLAPRTTSPADGGTRMAQEPSQSDQLLRDQQYPPPPDALDTMSSGQAPSPNEPSTNDAVTAGSADSDGADNNGEGRKSYGKRELSTSKRAAQNRAAQRAFRQRKEGYIKKLEEQVRDYQSLSDNFKAVQAENYQLRDYIISLQSRLLESQGEVPPPPSNVDGLQPGKPGLTQPSGSLPRLSELGQPQDGLLEAHHSSYPDPTYSEAPIAKRARTGSAEMSPSQAALQGAAILSQQSAGGR